MYKCLCVCGLLAPTCRMSVATAVVCCFVVFSVELLFTITYLCTVYHNLYSVSGYVCLYFRAAAAVGREQLLQLLLQLVVEEAMVVGGRAGARCQQRAVAGEGRPLDVGHLHALSGAAHLALSLDIFSSFTFTFGY